MCKLWYLCAFLAVGLPAPYLAASPVNSEEPVADHDLAVASQHYKEAVTSALSRAAKRAGVTLDRSAFVTLSNENDFVINAGISGFDALDELAMSKGQKIGLIFLSQPKAIAEKGAKRAIPGGYYVVRATVKPGSQAGEAQLLDSSGKVVVTVPLEYETTPSDDGLSAGVGGGCVYVDYKARRWRIVVSLCI